MCILDSRLQFASLVIVSGFLATNGWQSALGNDETPTKEKLTVTIDGEPVSPDVVYDVDGSPLDNCKIRTVESSDVGTIR